MAYHWVHPPSGALKINVHGVYCIIPLPNRNDTRICAVYKGANGDLKLLTMGVIPGLSRSGIGNLLSNEESFQRGLPECHNRQL